MLLVIRSVYNLICKIFQSIFYVILVMFSTLYIYMIVHAKSQYCNDDAMLVCVSIVICKHYQLMLSVCKNTIRSWACSALETIYVNGWMRVLAFLASLTVMAVFVVYTLETGVAATWDISGDMFTTRMENNMISITEDRSVFESSMIHPSTEGRSNPLWFYKFFRYRMEDVEMKCTAFTDVEVGAIFSAGQIEWRLNGVPIKMSDRHFNKMRIKEVTDINLINNFEMSQDLESYGTLGETCSKIQTEILCLEERIEKVEADNNLQSADSLRNHLKDLKSIERTNRKEAKALERKIEEKLKLYINQSSEELLNTFVQRRFQIDSTLTIRLLKGTEFGSYTCHLLRDYNIRIIDYMHYSNLIKVLLSIFESMKFRSKHKKQNCKQGQPNPHPRCAQTCCENGNKPNCQETRKISQPQCHQTPDVRHFYKDEYTWHGEFRLIEIKHKQEVISVPPGAILSFKTNYWRLPESDDLGVDYFVNGHSFLEVCPGIFRGCSKILLLYWKLYHSLGGFGLPPLQLIVALKYRWPLMKQYQHIQCLCEHSYGYHRVQFVRDYYNRSSNKYELIEIVHPHELYVIPRLQTMLSMFVNNSVPTPIIRTSKCSTVLCDAGPVVEELQFLKDFASLIWSTFSWWELFILLIVLAALLWIIYLFYIAMATFSRKAKHFFLQSSAVIHCLKEKFQYDIYFSYTDTDIRQVTGDILNFLETLGLRIYVRDRDTPPNVQEMAAWSYGIENSNKFIIFISPDYLQDQHREYEANVIVDSVYGRLGQSSEKVLVIKLVSCLIPLQWSTFSVHDWTALSEENKFLRLKKWAAPHMCGIFEMYVYGSLITGRTIITYFGIFLLFVVYLVCVLAYRYNDH